MSQRLNYGPSQQGTPGTVHICGNFTTANTADPTVFSSGPFKVTRSAAGRLLVTFKENFSEFLSGDAHVMDATAGAKACFIDYSTVSLGTNTTGASFIIETQSTAGTKADLAASPISFDVNWRKGTLKK